MERTSGPTVTSGRNCDGSGGTFSQAPQAVRSARSSGWDRVFPASAETHGTLRTDKGHTFRLTVQVHGLRHISCAAAVGTHIRMHRFPPQVEKIVYDNGARFTTNRFSLRIPNKISRIGKHMREDGGPEPVLISVFKCCRPPRPTGAEVGVFEWCSLTPGCPKSVCGRAVRALISDVVN